MLAHYEGQTGEEAAAEDEDAMRPSETVMSVPHDLVPAVRELIAKRRVKGGRVPPSPFPPLSGPAMPAIDADAPASPGIG